MSDRFSFSFLCLLLVFIAAMPAAAQKMPQTPSPAAAPSAQSAEPAQPEPPRTVILVEVSDNLLTVEFENTDFGAAIKAVAEKAGFKIEGTGEVFSRKLNTKFTDIEIERGVLRLLTLVKENNYTLHYDTRGLISKLEIFGIGSGKAPSVSTRQPMRPIPAVRQPATSSVSPQAQRPVTVSPAPETQPVSPALRRRPVISRPITPPQPVAQPSNAAEPQADEEVKEAEEPVNEIPYVAPQPRFSPAPARRP